MIRAQLPGWAPPAGVLGAAVLYSVVATIFEPYTTPMRVATALPCAVVAGAAARFGASRLPAEPPRLTGGAIAALAAWAVLILAAVSFQLALFVSQPRAVYPTFSSLAGDAFGWPPVRTAAFALWLWIGWYLLRR